MGIVVEKVISICGENPPLESTVVVNSFDSRVLATKTITYLTRAEMSITYLRFMCKAEVENKGDFLNNLMN